MAGLTGVVATPSSKHTPCVQHAPAAVPDALRAVRGAVRTTCVRRACCGAVCVERRPRPGHAYGAAPLAVCVGRLSLWTCRAVPRADRSVVEDKVALNCGKPCLRLSGAFPDFFFVLLRLVAMPHARVRVSGSFTERCLECIVYLHGLGRCSRWAWLSVCPSSCLSAVPPLKRGAAPRQGRRPPRWPRTKTSALVEALAAAAASACFAVDITRPRCPGWPTPQIAPQKS